MLIQLETADACEVRARLQMHARLTMTIFVSKSVITMLCWLGPNSIMHARYINLALACEVDHLSLNT